MTDWAFRRMAASLTLALIAACSMEETNNFVWAAYTGNLARVQEMVAQGKDVDARAFDDGQTALIAAARADRVEVIAYLIAEGADINQEDAGGTPLYWAAFEGKSAAFSYLRLHGGRLNVDAAKLERLLAIMRDRGLTDLAASVEAAAREEG